MSEATVLLAAVEQGDSKAAAELLELVYDELRHLASAKMSQQAPGQTLQATGLVHEAYLRLAGQRTADWSNRAQFLGLAASMMRRIRTRLPTYLSTGLGALVDISKHSWDCAPGDEAKRKRSMPQAPVPSNPARRIGLKSRQFEQ